MSLVGRIRKRNSGFVPTDITGLGLWLDAADSNTITKTGNNVSAWNDKSGNARNTSSVGGTNPQYSSTGGNGSTPAIQFGASNDALFNAYNFTDDSLAFFIVIKPYATQPNGSTNTAGVISTDKTGQFGRSLGILNNKYEEEYRNGFTDTGVAANSNSWEFVSLEFKSTTSAQFVRNGGTPIAVTASGASNNDEGLKIGSYNSQTGYAAFNANFDTSEILIYTASISNGDRQKIEGYLAWKWGLTSALPVGHPYKTAPPFTSS